MSDKQAARLVLRHFLQQDPLDADVVEFVELLNRNEVSSMPNRVGLMWTWLASQVQHRARGSIVGVPSVPASEKYPARDAFVEWTTLDEEHHHSGSTLAWAWVRALSALLCPTIRTQADANRLVPAVLDEEHGPREVWLIADAANPIYLTRIRPPGKAVGIDAINGAWSDGPTSEAWPALTRVTVVGAGEWVRMLALACRDAGVAFEQIEPPTGQGSQR